MTSPTPFPVPELDFGREGAPLAFLHANAYPPECYRHLLSQFAENHRVRAMKMRPLWQSSSNAAALPSWHQLSSDFLVWLNTVVEEPIVAMGHSLGAIVALRAALKETGRFRALILLDPVLLTRGRILAWRLARHLPMGHPLQGAIHRAEMRRRVFRDVDEAFIAYRRRPIFRELSDERLREVIDGLLEERDGRFELRYSPAWEARIYATAVWNDGDLWERLPNLDVPTLIIRGAKSDTFTEAACRAALRSNRRVEIAIIEGATHLVPLERPLEVHRLASQFIERALAPNRTVSDRPDLLHELHPA